MAPLRLAHVIALFILTAGLTQFGWTWGCSSRDAGQAEGRADGSGASSPGFIDVDATISASRLCTQDGTACVSACQGKGTTTIIGKVYDPAGKNPIWNAQVFVPYKTPGPMPKGPICNCSSVFTGQAIAAAQTDATGTFVIGDANLPAPGPKTGSMVPLVVQVGKWRYQTRVAVTCGMENKVRDGELRLPDGRMGSSDPNVKFPGDLPDIAVSTGGCDSLECLFRRVGVAESEYVACAGSNGGGHIHIYQGSPAGGGAGAAPNTSPGAPQSSFSLWPSTKSLLNYDAVLLSCEGLETQGPVPSSLAGYIKMGGRAFASHYHYNWFVDPVSGAPADPTFANFGNWYTKYVNALEGPAYGLLQANLPNGHPFPRGWR